MEELGKDVQESSGCNTWWLSHPPKNKTEWDALWVRIFRWVAHLQWLPTCILQLHLRGVCCLCNARPKKMKQKQNSRSQLSAASNLKHLRPHIYTSHLHLWDEQHHRVFLPRRSHRHCIFTKKPRKMGKFEEMQPWWLTKCIPLTV